jgi:hypothetical protein
MVISANSIDHAPPGYYATFNVVSSSVKSLPLNQGSGHLGQLLK